jgi:hypothetical protein
MTAAAYGIAMPVSRGTLGFVPYCTPAINFFGRLATQPTSARKTLYDTMIKALVSAGVWSKLDVLYLFAAADQATALTNLVQSSYGAAVHGSVTFTADHGVQSDGSTGYLDTTFTPSTAGGMLARDSAAAGIWSLTAGAAAPSALRAFGANDGTQALAMIIKNSSNQINSLCNSFTSALMSNSATDGFFTLSRTSSTGWDVSRNASSLGTASPASVGLPTVTMFALATHQSGSAAGVDNKQHAAFFLGGGLSSSDLTNLYNALHAYLQAVAGVA